MIDSFPLRNLVKLNLMLAVVISLFVLVFQTISGGSTTNILVFSLLAAVVISGISFMQVLLIVLFAKNDGTRSSNFRIQRYYLSFIYSSAIYLMVWPFFSWLTNLNWQWSNFKLLAILSTSSVCINAVILVVQDYLILHNRKAKADSENSDLKIAHAEATNYLLKQQIHPHFLFNALNTMNTLYRKDLELGEHYMIHLANFLRSSVTKQRDLSSTVGEELKFCNDYMVMQGIRFGKALVYQVDVGSAVRKATFLPSFSLQPLLENAIKHNEFTVKSPLVIDVSVHNDYIVITNNLKEKKQVATSSSTGLANLAERFRLWSGDAILLKNDGSSFSVSLKISYESNNH